PWPWSRYWAFRHSPWCGCLEVRPYLCCGQKAERRSVAEDDHGAAGEARRVEAEDEVRRVVAALVLAGLGHHLVALGPAGTGGHLFAMAPAGGEPRAVDVEALAALLLVSLGSCGTAGGQRQREHQQYKPFHPVPHGLVCHRRQCRHPLQWLRRWCSSWCQVAACTLPGRRAEAVEK